MTQEEFDRMQQAPIIAIDKEEKQSFTKSVMVIVILLYFIGAVLGGILVVAAAIVNVGLTQSIDAAMFIAYSAYLGAPTATAIGFYAWKSKAENLLKIKNSYEQSTTVVESTTHITSGANIDRFAEVLANMGGTT